MLCLEVEVSVVVKSLHLFKVILLQSYHGKAALNYHLGYFWGYLFQAFYFANLRQNKDIFDIYIYTVQYIFLC